MNASHCHRLLSSSSEDASCLAYSRLWLRSLRTGLRDSLPRELFLLSLRRPRLRDLDLEREYERLLRSLSREFERLRRSLDRELLNKV